MKKVSTEFYAIIKKLVIVFFLDDFLDKGVINFAEKNPSVAIYINEKKGEHPLIEAKYCMILLNNMLFVLRTIIQPMFDFFSHQTAN